MVAAVVGVDSEIQEHHLGVNHDDAQGGVAPGGEPEKVSAAYEGREQRRVMDNNRCFMSV
ncbi:MAG: hypothetical protein MR005_02440 [Prevotella sp.]|nr:hypothetical protein [Prevotella sp.]